jgi:hypothetical protein
MRNKIPCSADRLTLLDPQMIQAVSEASAFQMGHQYLSENRVRIVEADDAQISSAVIGNSGLYEQTIRLRDGHLVSKCSCTLPEEPMCRHCIAVLLEYHRWSQPRRKPEPRESKPQPHPQSAHVSNGKASAMPSSSGPDVKLGEVMQFVEWLQPAIRAIEKKETIPNAPQLGTGEVGTWIQTIRTLEERRRESEEQQIHLKSEMKEREAYVGRLTEQLQTSMAEVKAAQATSLELQRQVAAYKSMLSKVGDLSSEIARYDGQIKSVAAEMLSKGSQLDKLAHSFKEVAEALKSVTKPAPPR